MHSSKRSAARDDSPRNLEIAGRGVELDDGTVIRRSLRKTLVKIGFAVTCAFGGIGVTAVSIGGMTQAWAQKPEYLVFILLALAVFALIGLGVLALGAVFAGAFVVALWHNERLVIGKTCLQCIVGNSDAKMQIPFDNMDALAWAAKANADGSEFNYIGINLADRRRADTVSDLADMKANRENFGFDQVILDDYEISLDRLFARLKSRWTKATI